MLDAMGRLYVIIKYKGGYMKVESIIISIVFALTGCATFSLVPLPAKNIQIENNRGKSVPIYNDEKIKLVIIPKIEESDIMLEISVKNNSDTRFEIHDTDFIVENSSDGLQWQGIKTYSSKEYYTKTKASYNTGMVLLAISSALDTASAGRGSTSTSGNFYGTSRSGSISGSYYGRTTYYDPTAAELARQRDMENVANYRQRGQDRLEMLENNLFYSKIIEPSEKYFGLVFSDIGKYKYFRIIYKNESASPIEMLFLKVAEK